MGPSDHPRLQSQAGISEMAVILMSLGVAPSKNGRGVLQGDAAVDMGFERGFLVHCATGWKLDGEEQLKEVELARPSSL